MIRHCHWWWILVVVGPYLLLLTSERILVKYFCNMVLISCYLRPWFLNCFLIYDFCDMQPGLRLELTYHVIGYACVKYYHLSNTVFIDCFLVAHICFQPTYINLCFGSPHIFLYTCASITDNVHYIRLYALSSSEPNLIVTKDIDLCHLLVQNEFDLLHKCNLIPFSYARYRPSHLLQFVSYMLSFIHMIGHSILCWGTFLFNHLKYFCFFTLEYIFLCGISTLLFVDCHLEKIMKISGSGRFLIWLAKRSSRLRNYLGLEIRPKVGNGFLSGFAHAHPHVYCIFICIKLKVQFFLCGKSNTWVLNLLSFVLLAQLAKRAEHWVNELALRNM